MKWMLLLIAIGMIGLVSAGVLIVDYQKVGELRKVSDNLFCQKMQENDLDAFEKYCEKDKNKDKDKDLEVKGNLQIDVLSNGEKEVLKVYAG